MLYTLLFVTLLSGVTSLEKSNPTSGCVFDMTELPKNAPLLLTNQMNLIRPTPQKTIAVKEREEIVFVCAGTILASRAFVKINAVKGVCSNKEFLIDDLRYTVRELGCKSKVSPKLELTSRSCAQGAGRIVLINFSFRLQGVPNSLRHIEVCFDREESRTYYTRHTILGLGLSAAEYDGSRPSFKNGLKSLYPSMSPSDSYGRREQEATFSKLLGENEAHRILNITTISRGHLTPDADFIYARQQDGTYYYVNAAPQWQNFNSKSWATVEISVREVARKSLLDFEVITGTYKTLSVPDENGRKKDMYLYQNGTDSKLPVPMFFWKVVVATNSKVGIGFIGINSYGENHSIDWPCPNICDKFGWNYPSFKNSVICCTVGELSKVISFMPKQTIGGILQGPKK